ncbi:hypothetical protein CTheo_8096 [Ceratobasidium theobromae]|uniref:Fungal-type protein kinase domain-containing protein n=1 Tax=Ceratobasidium theobromae TaxID=1582974 RepID=A0A5N5QAD7_9AGAM|nr:hypothetical protein CTheo_8096 [Ceratobasidium theobromae]
MGLATLSIGQPLDKITSLRQLLCVMYDVCALQRNLYRKANILHWDISDINILAAPTEDLESYERCTEGYDEIKYINQVLAKDREVKPKPACLVIALGNHCADRMLIVEGAKMPAAQTGTPKFIARSVSSGKVLKGLVSSKNLMPKLEGGALELCEFLDKTQHERFNRAIDDAPLLDERSPNLQFKHQLFHDAESVFWVIAWTLARSTRPVYKAEVEWHSDLKVFIDAMNSHILGPERVDPRKGLEPDLGTWRDILHRDLASMASMISQMHEYIWPEWTLRDTLDPEHAHEALMRLLLTEIVHIDDTVDIPLSIGTRSLPRLSKKPSPVPSITLQATPDGPGPSSSKKGSVSELGDAAATNPTPRRSPRLAGRGLSGDPEPRSGAQTPTGTLNLYMRQTWEGCKPLSGYEYPRHEDSTIGLCIMIEVHQRDVSRVPSRPSTTTALAEQLALSSSLNVTGNSSEEPYAPRAPISRSARSRSVPHLLPALKRLAVHML